MPIEAELKARVRDIAHVRARLDRLDTEEVSTYRDTYYDRPSRELTRQGRELRVRVVESARGTRTLLTYKSSAVDAASGSKPEHETTAGSASVLDAILGGLGFVHLVSFEKHCSNYTFTAEGRAIQATLVNVPELEETFIEIETLVDDASEVDAALQVVRGVLVGLGVNDQDVTADQYTDVVMAARGMS